MENFLEVNEILRNWNEIKHLEDWGGILLGNGASISVWNNFKYTSLFEKATSASITDPLNERDIRLFTSLNTTNFEQVLSYLSIGEIVNNALTIDSRLIRERYTSIQNALIQAVRSVHVLHSSVPTKTLEDIRHELLNYEYVFSTNYDLLVYWAIMAQPNGDGFKDFFFGEEPGNFDLSNTEIWGKATKVLYLHGGLHLYRLPTGEVKKLIARDYQTILDLFGQVDRQGIPLFITEGTSEQKLSSIYNSDYLSFAYSRFANNKGPLVVFGSSLGPNDKHLLSAMKSSANKTFAISLMPDTRENIISQKARIFGELPNTRLYFYDATTHPLGNPNLKITIPVE